MHDMTKNKEFAYVNLEKWVVSDELGGRRHIEGVFEGFSPRFKLTFISHDSKKIDSKCKRVEIGPSFYYLRIATFLLLSSYDVVNFRKTLIGMYICVVPIILRKILGDRTIYILEYNGISGDFRVSSIFLKKLFLYLNSIPLLVYDKAYCVNDNIASRLASVPFVKKSSLYVCPNGCFVPEQPQPKLEKRDQIELVFYGSNQPKYHIEWFLSSVGNCHYVANIHLFGHGLEQYQSHPKVTCHGSRRPIEFIREVNTILYKGINLYGIIPLDALPAGTDIIPIKAMDYLSVPIPIISSNACLTQPDFDDVRFSYVAGDKDALIDTIMSVVQKGQYSEKYWEHSLKAVAQKYTWQQTLKPLVNSIE